MVEEIPMSARLRAMQLCGASEELELLSEFFALSTPRADPELRAYVTQRMNYLTKEGRQLEMLTTMGTEVMQ